MNTRPHILCHLIVFWLLSVVAGSAATVSATFNAATTVPVTASSYSATGNTVDLSLNFAPATGTTLTVVKNTGIGFIDGTFGNLAQGQQVELNFSGRLYKYVANYFGGSGNDLVLQWAVTRLFAWGDNTYGQLGNGSTTMSRIAIAVNMAGVLSGKTVIAEAGSGLHSLALCSDGTLATWGWNSDGQLGNGNTTNSNAPVAVDMTGAFSGKAVVSVAAGSNHSLALCSDGTMVAWGSNARGKLGNGGTASSSVPVAVSMAGVISGKTVVAVAAGANNSVALCSDGTVAAWGSNDHGQLGNGTATESNVPVAVDMTGVLSGKTVIAVAAGGNNMLALCSDGSLSAWGRNSDGQLGTGTTFSSNVPVRVSTTGFLFGKTVVAISAGNSHNLALCADGTLAAWGDNSLGQLGNGGAGIGTVPAGVSTTGGLSGKSAVAISAGSAHSLALCSDGTLVGWGYNVYGQLGTGNVTSSNVPLVVNTGTLTTGGRFVVETGTQGVNYSLWVVAVPFAPRMAVEQPAGRAVGSGGSTVDFGSTTLGNAISKTFTIKNDGIAPLTIDNMLIDGADAADFVVTTPPETSVAVGSSTTFAVTFNATEGFNRSATLHIFCNDPDASDFHFNLSGTVPSILTATYTSGSEVPLSAVGFTATGSTVNLTLNHAPVTGTTLTVVSNTGLGFINGTFGNLAQGQIVTLSYEVRTYEFVANYFGGSGNDLVLRWAATRPLAWGENLGGQLGVGGTVNSSVPVAVNTAAALSGKTIVAEAAGRFHSLALCVDGTLAAWGSNTYGQLGNGTTNSRYVPMLVNQTGVLAGKTVVAVAAGLYHSLVLCSDGTLAAWGENSDSQLGNGGSMNSSVPVFVNMAGVLSGRTVVAIAAGGNCSLALCSDGTLASWGSNSSGQLGNGSAIGFTVRSNVPVAVNMTGVLSGKTVTAIAAGSVHNLALCSDGTLAAWGTNSHGELGNGGTASSNVPVAVNMAGVLSGKTVTAITAGGGHCLALCLDGKLAAWGFGYYGQLGNGDTSNRNLPVAVNASDVLSGKTVVAVSAGSSHSLVLCSDGTLAAWGANSQGQLGNGGTTQNSVPVKVSTTTLAVGEKIIAGTGAPSAVHSLGIVALPFIPRMVMEQPAGTALTGGGSTADFGSNTVGNGISKTFTIKNNGIVPLAIDSVLIDGANAADFVLTTPPDAIVAAGSSTTFAITFTAGAEFNRSAALHVASNDPYTSIFQVNLTATVTGVLTAAYASGSEVPLNIPNFTATGSNVNFTLGHAPATGTALKVVENTGLGFIKGEFGNLAQGQAVALTYAGLTYRFVANYFGGSGNDLVLQWAATRPLAWGNNHYGELGNGGTTESYVPAAVNAAGLLSGKTIIATAAGYGVSLAACSDGTLAAWGANNSGQLGIGNTVNSSVPVAVNMAGVLAGKTVIAMSAGYDHCLALCSDGTVAAWGNNQYGLLGNGTYTSSNVPVAVNTAGVLAGKSVVAVSAGYSHSLALCDDGTVAAWGSYGGATSSSVPAAVDTSGALSGKTVIAVSSGYGFSLALCSDGTLAAWGDARWGQLGNGGEGSGSVPVAVNTAGILSGKSVIAVAAGYHHGLALCSDGTLAAWGENSDGQLGNGSTNDGYVPVAVNQTGVLAGKSIVAVSAGYGHSLVRCSDGTLAAWGRGSELGYGSPFSRSVPVAVSTTSLEAGESFMDSRASHYATHNVALAAVPFIPRISVEPAGGVVLTDNRGGVIFGSTAAGAGITTSLTIKNKGIEPLVIGSVVIDGADAADFILTTPPAATVAAGSSTTFAVTFTAGAGFSHSAALHIASNDPYTGIFDIDLGATISGALSASYSSASDVPLSAIGFTATGSSVNFTLGFAPATGTQLMVVRQAGLAFINGTFSNLEQGQLVTLDYGGMPYKFVANYYGGSGNDLVLQWAATRPLAWGRNNYGQLGLGSTTSSSVPVAVNTAGALSGKTVVVQAAGYNHSLALCSDGTVAAWGYNGDGQLGNGFTTDSKVPVAVNTAGVLSGRTVIAIATGRSHSLVLCSDGTLAAWGENSYGQLGNGSTTGRNVPVLVNQTGVLSGKSVVAVTAGKYHSLALCSDGTLAAWGSNSTGQLGNGSAMDYSTKSNVPVAVSMAGLLSGKMVIAVTAGGSHSLALCSDGTLAAWGYNSSGQLGIGSTTNSNVPVAVNMAGAFSGKGVIAVAAGSEHSLALCADGTLGAWGYNTSGQLGNGSNTSSQLPVTVSAAGALSGKTVVALSAGDSNSLALCSDGTLAAWGYNYYGQLGNSGKTSGNVPVVVSTATLALGEKYIAGTSAQNADHSLGLVAMPFIPRIVVEQPAGTALVSGGSTVEFENNAVNPETSKTFTLANHGVVPLAIESVLIDGANSGEFVLTTPPSATVAAGSSTTFVITFTAGAGFARSAVLHIASNDPHAGIYHINLAAAGAGTLTAAYHTGSEVPLTASRVVATGGTVDFALHYPPLTGAELAVVRNTGLGLIEGYFNNLEQGQIVELTYDGITYKFMANYYGGSGNDLVLRWAASRPVAWGRNTDGQLGNGGTSGSSLPAGVDVAGVLSGKTVIGFAAGEFHSLALCSDGTLAAWGDNSVGQLGNASLTSSTVPVEVSTAGLLAGRKVVAIAAGYAHSLALCSDGTLAAWGYNPSGQIGNNSTANSDSPVVVNMAGVLGGRTVVSIAAGAYHSLALCMDGTVASWGYNFNGQLGNGNTTNSKVPVAVNATGALSNRKVVSVAAGSAHNLALCSDGTLAAWGYNSYGQLGNGNTADSYVPVMVDSSGLLSDRTVTIVAAGQRHCLVLCSDGTVASWGYNSNGQLGNGSATNSTVPVAVNTAGVLAGQTIIALSAGYRHSLALCSDGTLAAWGYNVSGQLGTGSMTSSNVPVTTSLSSLPEGARVVIGTSGQSAYHSLGNVALPPPAANTLAATGITDAVATLNSTVNASGSSTSVSFEWGLSTVYGNLVAGLPTPVNGTATTSVSGLIGGLVAGTTYHYRVVASSLGGTVRGEDMTFATLSDNSDLAALELSSGTLTPDFKPLTADYVATVPYATGGVTVTPTTHHPEATARVEGVEVASGVASSVIDLNVGNTRIETVVTAEDGFTTRTYTITVTRLPLNFAFQSASDVPVTADGFVGKGIPVDIILGYRPVPGTILMVVNNRSLGFIHGRFKNLAQGQRVTLRYGGTNYDFVANYFGGTGNDLVLQWADTIVAAWGSNSYGQLGDGTTTQRLLPTSIDDGGVLFGKTIVAVGGGYLHSLALCSDGSLVAWGYNTHGQLGNNSTAPSRVPVAVDRSGVLAGRTVIAISAGPFHNLALCSDGTVAAWGFNNHGQLGTGDKLTSLVPVKVKRSGALAGKQVVAVAAGAYQSFALCSDGSVAGWGYNDEGELGNGGKSGSLEPVAVDLSGALAGKRIASISAGQYHTLALCTDGTLAAWGYNNRGQLGNDSILSSKVPVAIGAIGALAGKTVVAIGASGAHSLALCADGTLAAWGWNHRGQLGVSGIAQSAVPVAIDVTGLAAGSSLSRIAAGSAHSLVLRADGALAAWGDNAYGQLGNNSLTPSFMPTAVDTSSLVAGSRIMFATGGSAALHNLAVVALPSAGRKTLKSKPLAMSAGIPGDDEVFNLIEHAFGLNASTGALPQAQTIGDKLVIRFTEPAGVTGITYGAEWSRTMLPGSWSNVPDTGTGTEHIFSVPADTPHLFMRLKVTD